MKRRNLVIVRAGNSSLHPEWLKGDGARNWDIVVNYFGVPVVGSVSFLARTSYLPLRKFGPNDGTVLLPDMIFPGGVTLTELGSDHFMRRKPLDIVTVALTITVINWLEHPDGEWVRVGG